MGSFARVRALPVRLDEALARASAPIIGCALEGRDIHGLSGIRDAVVVVGGEGRGLSEGVRGRLAFTVTIPRAGRRRIAERGRCGRCRLRQPAPAGPDAGAMTGRALAAEILARIAALSSPDVPRLRAVRRDFSKRLGERPARARGRRRRFRGPAILRWASSLSASTPQPWAGSGPGGGGPRPRP